MRYACVFNISKINVIDNLRRLRHNINYYGYKPKISETKDVIEIAHTFFRPLLNETRKKIIPILIKK